MSMRDRVVAALTETVLVGKPIHVGDEESLLEAGLLDSLGMMELVEVLKQRFAITVGDHELTPENLDSISGITGFLAGKGVQP